MQPANNDRFHLRHRDLLIEVEFEPNFMEPVAKLFIDGELVDEQSSWPETTELNSPDLAVFVKWTLLSRPQRAWAVFEDEKVTGGDEDGDDVPNHPEHDLIPPPGSWAERVYRFANNHPNVYASRHVVKATLQALLGIIGIWAILWGLLPRFDIDVPFPDIELGDWIRSIVPGWVQSILQFPQRIFTWLFGWVPEITIFERFVNWVRTINFPPEWLKSVVSSARYWIPILLAIAVALNEIDRRNKKNNAEPEEGPTPDVGSDGSPADDSQDSPATSDEEHTNRKPD